MKNPLLPFCLLAAMASPFFTCAQYTTRTEVHPKTWKFNSGMDFGAWWGGTGVSPLKVATDPLVHSNLAYQVAYTGDVYFEWLHRKDQTGSVGPDFGIKTKLVWDYFSANNNGVGNGFESLTLNYINVPLLFEYCLSFKNKVTQPRYVAPSSNSQTYEYDHGYYYHIITTTTNNPGGYIPGGVPYSNAIFMYAGPQICYLTRGFHNLNGQGEGIDTDPAMQKSYIGFVGGFCFYLANLNLDLSYQRGLTSIAKGENVYVEGFFLKAGFNFSKRKF
ncbi:MAG TPA: hypothetical protein VKR53_13580 [Puia sp.]|nr:hypothetical protein [Puia sp.]